jgi:hypothetical protein
MGDYSRGQGTLLLPLLWTLRICHETEISMLVAKTHLGNSQLHRNKSVMIEGGMFPRSRVMNQHMIDQYLMHGTLNLAQHKAGEYLLQQAAQSGMWPTGVNLSGIHVDGGKKDWSPRNSFGFVRTLKVIEKKYGWFHSWLVVEVVVRDWDVSKFPMRMTCLKQALDWIMERRMRGGSDPVERLRIAAKKKEGAGFPTP